MEDTSNLGKIIYCAITLIALYLSFQRNNGFELGSFLIALLFAPIYIIYALALSKSK